MRNSSVELFRIISTLLVLIVHFNGWFVGMPKEFSGFTLFPISQDIIESISIVCVNCFLAITGWYGLRFKWKHVWTIYSVLVWIYVPLFCVQSYLTGHFSKTGFLLSFLVFGRESYYVQCYLMLLFLSPILNAFITKYGRRILPYTLSFWLIEITFDWLLDNKCLGFGKGYELTHFVFMYILGRTLFLYQNDIKKILSRKKCIFIFISGAMIISVMHFFFSSSLSFAYSNPINVIMTFSLFIFFEYKFYENKIINWISKSTLAVYIIHITSPIINILRKWDNYILAEYNYFIYLLIMLATIICVFICGILYDKIKELFMPYIGKRVCEWISDKTKKYDLSK